jgi:hypothetical protein
LRVRDRELKGLWEDLATGQFATFREQALRMSPEELLAFRGRLLSDLARLPSLNERPEETTMAVANDNARGRTR